MIYNQVRSRLLIGAALLISLAASSAALAQYTAPSRCAGRTALRGNGSLLVTARSLSPGGVGGMSLYWPSSSGNWTGGSSGYEAASCPVVIVTSTDQALMMARGTDGKMVVINEGPGGDLWDAFPEAVPHLQSNGSAMPSFSGEPDAVRNSNGTITMYGIAGGSLWHSTRSSSGWSRWTSLGKPSSGNLTDSPAVFITASGGTIAFVRGAEGSLWYREQSNSGTWGTWRSLGGSLADSSSNQKVIDVAANANSRLSVYVVNSNGTISYKTQTGTGYLASWTSSWTSLGNTRYGSGFGNTGPSVAPNYDNRLSLFATSIPEDGAPVYWKAQASTNSNTWNPSGWAILTEWKFSAPSAIRDLGGKIHVIVKNDLGELIELTHTVRNGTTYTESAYPVAYGPVEF